MQGLLDAPRSSLTAAQVTAVIQAPSLTVGRGLDLLDGNDQFVSDISASLVTGQVDRDCSATIHGTCTLTLAQALSWGSVRVRPWMTLSGAGQSNARFNLGVFVLTASATPIGQNPPTWDVQGYDKLYLLDQILGDSYSVPAGTNVIGAVQAVIAAASAGGTVLIDATAGGKTTAADMVWTLDESHQPTYLQIIDDLLQVISYDPLWCDQNGAFRSEPAPNPATSPVGWAFTAVDPTQSLVGVDRTQTLDFSDVPNWWRFIQKGLSSAPTEGAGQYTVSNTGNGPNSSGALGRFKRKVFFLDVADQATLQAQGDAQVATDSITVNTLTLNTAPFPLVGHLDIYSYTDNALGGMVKVLNMKWSLPLDGSDMSHTWDIVG